MSRADRDTSPAYFTCDEDDEDVDRRDTRRRVTFARRPHTATDQTPDDRAYQTARGRESLPITAPVQLQQQRFAYAQESNTTAANGTVSADNVSAPKSFVKLCTFDGSSCLETFLAKFDNMSQYFHWSSGDKLFHLRASLEGSAGQVLWDTGPQSTFEGVVQILRARFGNDLQAERYRAEFHARRRKKGESLQCLYQDICKLLALGYPGQSNTAVSFIGRDAFLDALAEANMRIKILEREPKNVGRSLKLCL